MIMRSSQASRDSRGAPCASSVTRRAETRKRIFGSFDFTAHLEVDNLRDICSRWDTLVASPGVEPVAKGSYRLHNGWDFETYDRNRRDIAEAIITIQEALAQ